MGGKGASDSTDAGNHGKVVAICDIDDNTLSKKKQEFKDAATYNDFRKMFDEMGDKIDAVTVSIRFAERRVLRVDLRARSPA